MWLSESPAKSHHEDPRDSARELPSPLLKRRVWKRSLQGFGKKKLRVSAYPNRRRKFLDPLLSRGYFDAPTGLVAVDTLETTTGEVCRMVEAKKGFRKGPFFHVCG